MAVDKIELSFQPLSRNKAAINTKHFQGGILQNMAKDKTIVAYARKTFVALKNPYHSVIKVYPAALDAFLEDRNDTVRYIGVKNCCQVPGSLVKTLQKKGNYRLHTLDAASYGGRAVDINLKNPISGKPMTGSSSGTAINVLIGINDLGIGVDGGGSVLAPAMSVNLYGFISPLIERNFVSQFSKISTDQILFSPSIGFIAGEYDEIKRAIHCVLDLPEIPQSGTLLIPKADANHKKANEKILEKLPSSCSVTEIVYPCLVKDRRSIIAFLNQQLDGCDVLLSYEGPVDYEGFGDTVIGHFDELTSSNQQRSNKGLIRVVNMVNATALVVPASEFACGYVLICESKLDKISRMLQLAEAFTIPRDPLIQSYFTEFSCYFPREFGTDDIDPDI